MDSACCVGVSVNLVLGSNVFIVHRGFSCLKCISSAHDMGQLFQSQTVVIRRIPSMSRHTRDSLGGTVFRFCSSSQPSQAPTRSQVGRSAAPQHLSWQPWTSWSRECSRWSISTFLHRSSHPEAQTVELRGHSAGFRTIQDPRTT